MGMNLRYRLIGKERFFTSKNGDALKARLRDKRGVSGKPKVFDHSDIPYLEGLRDGGLEDAQSVIDAINKYREIEIYLK